VIFTAVPPGEHQVEIRDLQDNCTTLRNPVEATVVAGGTAPVTFPVTCWPPTNGRIVFTRNKVPALKIMSMSPDGTDLVEVTSEGRALWPVWSPNRWKIAFTCLGFPGGGKKPA
jgi:hypothetical protein